jgi:hypothetical protein
MQNVRFIWIYLDITLAISMASAMTACTKCQDVFPRMEDSVCKKCMYLKQTTHGSKDGNVEIVCWNCWLDILDSNHHNICECWWSTYKSLTLLLYRIMKGVKAAVSGHYTRTLIFCAAYVKMSGQRTAVVYSSFHYTPINTDHLGAMHNLNRRTTPDSYLFSITPKINWENPKPSCWKWP